jgi:hypothetical protein
MRLRRVYESAEEEGRPVEDVAVERFGSLEAFEEAREERKILDERDAKRQSHTPQRGRDSERGKSGAGRGGEKGFMFSDLPGSGASSRSSSFRRPGGSGRQTENTSGPSTPSPAGGPPHKRLDALRGTGGRIGSPLAQQQTPPQARTPIPSVLTPTRRALSPSSLNRLQAKVLRAKLMNSADAERLEKEYEEELARAHGGVDDKSNVRTKVEVLPTLDGRGRLYDVGLGGGDDGEPQLGNRKKKEKVRPHKASLT